MTLMLTPHGSSWELADCSLADELRADRTLRGDPRRPLFDILAGLEAIYDRGYKHRDLKPTNVLKFVSDGSVRYAISDFGLMSPAFGQTSTLTQSNMGGGTPLYRAPECAINFKRATNLSDIYSIGAILHDIFAGSRRIPKMHEATVLADIPIAFGKNSTKFTRKEFLFLSREEEEIVRTPYSRRKVLLSKNGTEFFNKLMKTMKRGHRITPFLARLPRRTLNNWLVRRRTFLRHSAKTTRNMPKTAASILVIAMLSQPARRSFISTANLI